MSKRLIAGLGVVAGLAVAMAPVATFATSSYYPNTHTDRLSVTIEEVCSFGHTYADGTVVNPGSHADGTGLGSPAETGTQADTPTSGHTAGKSYGKWELASGATGASAYDTQDTTDTENPKPSTDPRTGHTEQLKDTAYGIMETNTVNATFAKTTLAVICNTANGYQIKAVTSDLTKGAGTAAKDKIAYDGDHAMAMPQSGALASGWNFKVENTTTTADTTITTSTANGTAGLSAAGLGTITNNKSAYATDFTSGEVLVSSNGATSTLGDRLTVTYGVAVSPDQEAGTYEGDIVYTLVQL